MGLAKLEAKPDRCSIPGGRNDNYPLRSTWKPTVPISYPDPPEVGSFFFNLRIMVIVGLLFFNFPNSFFSILIHHTRD